MGLKSVTNHCSVLNAKHTSKGKTSKSAKHKVDFNRVAVIILIIATRIFLSNTLGKNHTSLTMVSSSNLDSGPYLVALTDASNNPLADKYIRVEIGNVTYTIKTDSDGIVSINSTLTDDYHEIMSYFKGDDKYKESDTSDIVIK